MTPERVEYSLPIFKHSEQCCYRTACTWCYVGGARSDRGGRSESVVDLPDEPSACLVVGPRPTSLRSHRRNTHVRITKRSTRYAALAVGLAFVAASCGSDDNNAGSNDTTGGTTAATTAATTAVTTAATTAETTGGSTETTGATSGGAAMTLTMNINPKAVWDDGTPIT